MPLDGFQLFELASSLTSNICFFMPRNVNQNQMIELAPGSPIELQEGYLNDRLKCMIVYYGSLVNCQETLCNLHDASPPQPKSKSKMKRKKIIKE